MSNNNAFSNLHVLFELPGLEVLVNDFAQQTLFAGKPNYRRPKVRELVEELIPDNFLEVGTTPVFNVEEGRLEYSAFDYRIGFFGNPIDAFGANRRRIFTGRREVEIRSIDGSGNNLWETAWGAAGTAQIRIVPAGDDNRNNSPMLPSTRAVSNEVLSRKPVYVPGFGNINNLAVIWGQFLDHDMTATPESETHEQAPIQVPLGDPQFDPLGTGTQTIPFTVSEKIVGPDGETTVGNSITTWIDGSNVYGSDEATASKLRRNDGSGKLRTIINQTGEEVVPIENGQFLTGDGRSGENPVLSGIHTSFALEHNFIADMFAQGLDNGDRLAKRFYRQIHKPGMSKGDVIYEFARSIVIAELQVITYNDFLPAFIGDAVPEYDGYKAHIDPSISVVFSTAAFRFGHDAINGDLYIVTEEGKEPMPLRDAFFNSSWGMEYGFAGILGGAFEVAANDIDGTIIDDLRNLLFGPPGAGGLDLGALNLQRGRDHRVPTLNDTREALGFEAYEDFSDVSSNPEVVDALTGVYANVDQVELWVGGLVEDDLLGSQMGETFTAIIADQFYRIRAADRFAYERDAFVQKAAAYVGRDLDTFGYEDILGTHYGINTDDAFIAAPVDFV